MLVHVYPEKMGWVQKKRKIRWDEALQNHVRQCKLLPLAGIKITNSQFSSFRARIWQNRMWKKVIKRIAVHPKVNAKRINCVTNQLPFKLNRGCWRNEGSSWSSKTELLVVNNGCFLLNALVWTPLVASVSSKLDCLLTWLECHKAT